MSKGKIFLIYEFKIAALDAFGSVANSRSDHHGKTVFLVQCQPHYAVQPFKMHRPSWGGSGSFFFKAWL